MIQIRHKASDIVSLCRFMYISLVIVEKLTLQCMLFLFPYQLELHNNRMLLGRNTNSSKSSRNLSTTAFQSIHLNRRRRPKEFYLSNREELLFWSNICSCISSENHDHSLVLLTELEMNNISILYHISLSFLSVLPGSLNRSH